MHRMSFNNYYAETPTRVDSSTITQVSKEMVKLIMSQITSQSKDNDSSRKSAQRTTTTAQM